MKKNHPAFSALKALLTYRSFSALRNSGLSVAVVFALLATGCNKESATILPKNNLALTVTAATVAAPGVSAYLGTAAGFTIFAKSSITSTGGATVEGNIVVASIVSNALTGFNLTIDPKTKTFSTASNKLTLSGKAYTAAYAAPTPANIKIALGFIDTAFSKLSRLKSMPTTVSEGAPVSLDLLYKGNLGGRTLAHGGIYTAAAGLTISGGTLTLTGTAKDLYIFQIGKALTVANNVTMILKGGLTAANIVWVAGTSANFGTSDNFYGSLVVKTLVSLNAKDNFTGRIYTDGTVTMAGSHVYLP